MQGPAGIWSSKVTKSPVTDPEEIAKYEAKGILSLTGKRNLRIHTVGDCKTDTAAQIVSKAAEEYMTRHNKKAWTYTHEHSTKRKSWGKVSVLRSCETLEQVQQSFKDGYAASMVVAEYKKDTAYELEPGVKGIPCPEITGRAKSCNDCQLCFNDDKLLKNKLVILFAAHGSKKKHMLPVLNS